MDLLNLLINKTVSIAVEKGLIQSNSIIVDATHTVSRSNPHAPLEVLKMRSKQLRRCLYEDDIADHYTTSTDSDALTSHKTKDSSFFGFKIRIAMSEERIITAATVTSGEKGDGPQLSVLVEISKDNGIQADTVIADTAYSGGSNLQLAEEQQMELI